MADETKKRTVTKVEAQNASPKHVEASGSSVGFRVGAIVLWVLAVACEVVAVLSVFGKINITFMSTLVFLIIMIVLDLVLVIVGSQLWKKANHINPASEKNKVLFFLWNNMGVIVTCVAFAPLVIILLLNKDLDKKTKTIATIVAIIALLIGSAASIDYNPISEEEKNAAASQISGTVYWSQFGKVYHTSEDCSALNRSDSLFEGDVDAAIENNRTRLCLHCAKRDGINTENIKTEE